MRRFIPLLVIVAGGGGWWAYAYLGTAARVPTVDEYLADEKLLAAHIAECRNDPGNAAADSRCQNAEAADGKARLERMKKALGG